ncbi:MAG: hypothetical protein LV473_16990 [Nitrospira sp.]|nr:hypothetical protein [Nitrospira sp.]
MPSAILPLVRRAGSLHPATVQLVGDATWRPSLGIPLKELPHPLRLLFVNLPPCRDDSRPAVFVLFGGMFDGHVSIPVQPATGVEPFEGLAGKPPVGLLLEVVQENVSHQALEPGQRLTPFRCRVDALRHADDADLQKDEEPADLFHLHAVTGKARHIVNQECLELPGPCGLDHGLEARPLIFILPPGDALIVVPSDYRPALTFRIALAIAKLVFDAGLPLSLR